MYSYQYITSVMTGEVLTTMIKRLPDNAFIPLTDLSNSDYQAYLKWVAEGNTPEPAEEPT
jgi:hypothetical protein